MSQTDHIWACTCRHETPCTPEDHKLGAVFECPACKQVWGCVRPRRGSKVWVPISEEYVEFHRLLEEVEDGE